MLEEARRDCRVIVLLRRAVSIDCALLLSSLEDLLTAAAGVVRKDTRKQSPNSDIL